MNYILNEHSLRNQFQSSEDFFRSIRESTLPVLKKIDKENNSVIWKKDTFWNQLVCNDCPLSAVVNKQNERSAESFALKNYLRKLYTVAPFWSEDEYHNITIVGYGFDEEYCNNLPPANCFSKAILLEGKIISFEHPAYSERLLKIAIATDSSPAICNIDNISSISWWDIPVEVKHWYIEDKYYVEVRANEFAYHPPHFHVSYNGYEAVYKLNDCQLFRDNSDHGHKIPVQFQQTVTQWYATHKEELQNSWNLLHEPVFR